MRKWTEVYLREVDCTGCDAGDWGSYRDLKNKEKFCSVFINEVGNVAWNIDESVDSSVHWENQIDLCKDMLYMESVPASLHVRS